MARGDGGIGTALSHFLRGLSGSSDGAAGGQHGAGRQYAQTIGGGSGYWSGGQWYSQQE